MSVGKRSEGSNLWVNTRTGERVVLTRPATMTTPPAFEPVPRCRHCDGELEKPADIESGAHFECDAAEAEYSEWVATEDAEADDV